MTLASAANEPFLRAAVRHRADCMLLYIHRKYSQTSADVCELS